MCRWCWGHLAGYYYMSGYMRLNTSLDELDNFTNMARTKTILWLERILNKRELADHVLWDWYFVFLRTGCWNKAVLFERVLCSASQVSVAVFTVDTFSVTLCCGVFFLLFCSLCFLAVIYFKSVRNFKINLDLCVIKCTQSSSGLITLWVRIKRKINQYVTLRTLVTFFCK